MRISWSRSNLFCIDINRRFFVLRLLVARNGRIRPDAAQRCLHLPRQELERALKRFLFTPKYRLELWRAELLDVFLQVRIRSLRLEDKLGLVVDVRTLDLLLYPIR